MCHPRSSVWWCCRRCRPPPVKNCRGVTGCRCPTKAQVQAESLFEPDGLTDRQLHRDLNAAENAELARLYDNGTISQATRQQLQRGLDLEATRLSHEQH